MRLFGDREKKGLKDHLVHSGNDPDERGRELV